MRTLRIAPAVLLVAALSLTACGSGGDTSPASSTTGGGSSAAPQDGEALLRSASDAIGGAPSFHLSGTISSGGVDLAIDASYGTGVAQGTVDVGDGRTVDLRRITDGTVYASGSQAFYAQVVTPAEGSGTDWAALGEKWVVVDDTAPSALSSLAGLLDRADLLSSLQPDSGGKYAVSGPKTVHGVSSYVVTDADGSTFAVAAGGDPLPVEFSGSSTDGSTGGDITFDGYGDDVTVSAPDDSEIVPIPS